MSKKHSFKLWHYILLAAAAGILPMTGILTFVIGTSVNKDINFGLQEMRGNTFQRPLEQLLDLFPRYQAAAGGALAGDESAKAVVADLRQQIDLRIGTLATNYNSELGRSLKFNDAELAARKRDDAQLAKVLSTWQNLKNAPLTAAAGGEATGKLVADVRMMIAHAGDLSNLILDTDLDSYYLVDITLSALPQTQQRLGEITQQVGDWLRAGSAAARKSDIAVMAAMLQQDDQDRITGDAQTSLGEDKNFYGVSVSLQKNLPPAIEKYTAADRKFLGLLNRIGAGESVPVSEFEAAGWGARDETFRLWETSADELDTLLSIRVSAFHHSRLLSFSGIGATFVLVVGMIWFLARRINFQLSAISRHLHASSEDVAGAAGQVSSAGQTLAEGASEQASSLEETSASLEEMASMTRRNTETARRANDIAKEARAAVEKGVSEIEMMSGAMKGIKESNDDIAKIIKTIDEIAFQTNILALNAAVEAARAGEAGLGFAVVADEVRNLAQRCAVAAKETTGKIEGAITRTGKGVETGRTVAKALEEIMAKVRQVDELVGEVAVASREQTEGITQINIAMSQMDTVTQSNAAAAEESAAAAQELHSQADAMKESVAELLQLVGSNSEGDASKTATPARSVREVQPDIPTANRLTPTNGNGHSHPLQPLPMAAQRRNGFPTDGDFAGR